MDNFRLKYNTGDSRGKGSIDWMVMRKCVNLAKSINYREKTKHGHSITKNRTEEETAEEGKWKEKVEIGFTMGTKLDPEVNEQTVRFRDT